MNSSEFYLWLNGYLEALESEEIEVCKISSIREKMKSVKNNYQERIVYGPNVPPKSGYAQQTSQPNRNI